MTCRQMRPEYPVYIEKTGDQMSALLRGTAESCLTDNGQN